MARAPSSASSPQAGRHTAASDTDKHGPVECKVRLEESRRPQTQEIHNENSKKKNQKASFSFQMTKKCNKRVLKTPRPSTKGGSKWNQKGFNQQLTRPKKKKKHIHESKKTGNGWRTQARKELISGETLRGFYIRVTHNRCACGRW